MDAAEVNVFLSELLAGRYRPTQFLDSGHFSGTFQARDQAGGAEVAAKILKIGHSSTPEAVEEFRDEVAVLRALTGCDRVVRLIDDGHHTLQLAHQASGGTIPVKCEFAILELAVGSLAKLLLHGPSFGWIDRLKLYRDVVKGVHQMHLKRIVHRDVKAENALLFERPAMAKIADMGRSHDTRRPPRFAVEAYLQGRGDLRFAPLEFLWLQGTQDADDQARADLYLLGSLLFEMGTAMGLTSMIAANPIDVMHRNAALPDDKRKRDFDASVPWLREAARPALETLAAEVPPEIRKRTVILAAMLTDPDPNRRLPSFVGSRRSVNAWDLEWLLHRIDGLRRAIDPELRSKYLANRRSHAPRHPRARKS